MAWENYVTPGSGVKNKTNTFAAQGALIANITQPLVAGLLLISVSDVPKSNKIAATAIMLFYICWMSYSLNKIKKVDKLTNTPTCGHLQFGWWKQVPGGPIFYFATLAAVVLLLLRPMKFAALEIGYITIALIAAGFIYSCGTASMWCWFAALAPLFTGIFWNMSQTKN